MTADALKIINDSMAEMGIPYELCEWTSDPVYPYFIGEYQETPTSSENGQQDTTFILTGFSRTTWKSLEDAKALIENYFDKIAGKIVIANPSGNAVAIFYDSAMVVPTGDAKLKRIQINLTVKEWKVN